MPRGSDKGDADPILPPSVLRSLGDKAYDKRKNAALELEQIVKKDSASGNDEKIQAIIDKLVEDYSTSHQANLRKGILLCLAAVTVGLGHEKNGPYLASVVPPVLKSFLDQDSGVRYYGLESLYNIAKVARTEFLPYFSDTFDNLFRLCADQESRVKSAAGILDNLIKDLVLESRSFDIHSFVPRLKRLLTVPHDPDKRRFLIDWTSVLQSVPDIDMSAYLPELLDGLMLMVSDSHSHIKQASGLLLDAFLKQIEKDKGELDYASMTQTLILKAKSSDDLTRFTAIRWINSFLQIGVAQAAMLTYLDRLVFVVLPCLSFPHREIREAASHCNSKLLAMDLSKQLMHAQSFKPVLTALAATELACAAEPTRLEALRWIQQLLLYNMDQVVANWNEIDSALLEGLNSESDAVVSQALLVLVNVAKVDDNFKMVMHTVVARFKGDNGRHLLQRRGALIIRGLCGMLGGIRVFSELATILDQEQDPAFASGFTQALNLMLLTAPELTGLRTQLQNALDDPHSAQLLQTLYSCWCHSACAVLSLCMLAQAYKHVDAMIHVLAELPLLPVLLAQIDRFVMLIDTPVFTRLRLQLLSPEKYPDLMRALYSLLMLCPQSRSFHTLHARLSGVPTLALLRLNDSVDRVGPRLLQELDSGSTPQVAAQSLPWEHLLQMFKLRQEKLISFVDGADSVDGAGSLTMQAGDVSSIPQPAHLSFHV